IHKELNVKVPLAEIFRTPTIKELAKYIESSATFRYASIEPVEKKEYYPLSAAQRRMYILHRMNPGNTSYNIQEIIYLDDVENEILRETFDKIIARHESLRTSIQIVGEEPYQRILDDVEFQLEYGKIKKNRETVGEEERKINDFIRPFDLSRAPLIRVGLIKITTPTAARDVRTKGREQNILIVDMHHIITDGTSHEVLKKEFAELSEGKELPPLRIQYKDYAHWQNSEQQKKELKQQEAYWKMQFEGEVPVLELPLDYPRPGEQGFEGAIVGFLLDEEETRIIKKNAEETGITLYMTLLAMFMIQLSKLSNQEEIIVGTPVAARRHADLEKIIGMFVNTLAIRGRPAGHKTLKQY
ncbi:MAG: non-ribosomal peptide synthetase, partial [bacterium]|nr:non-ribosomal peptide synthetase [bacterium]